MHRDLRRSTTPRASRETLRRCRSRSADGEDADASSPQTTAGARRLRRPPGSAATSQPGCSTTRSVDRASSRDAARRDRRPPPLRGSRGRAHGVADARLPQAARRRRRTGSSAHRRPCRAEQHVGRLRRPVDAQAVPPARARHQPRPRGRRLPHRGAASRTRRRLAGWLEYRAGPDEPRCARRCCSSYVPNEGDAWEYTLDAARRFLRACSADGCRADERRGSSLARLLERSRRSRRRAGAMSHRVATWTRRACSASARPSCTWRSPAADDRGVRARAVHRALPALALPVAAQPACARPSQLLRRAPRPAAADERAQADAALELHDAAMAERFAR